MRYLILLFVLTGCNANWHLQRAIKKDPFILVVDTVKMIDTVFVEVASVDTIFKYKFDTVEFWKDSVYVKYYYQVEDSLVYLEVDCPDKEVITDTKIITETIQLKASWKEKIRWIAIGVLIWFLVNIIRGISIKRNR